MSYEPEADDYGRSDVEARNKTNVPGILLLIVGIINILGALYYAFEGVISLANPQAVAAASQQMNPQGEAQMKQLGWSMEQMVQGVGVGYLVFSVIALIAAIITIFGGLQMRNLRGYGLSVFGSILAMIPCVSPCCLLGVVAGIWGLAVLMSQDVKSAFR